jgi:RecG-like helicase
VTIAGRVKAVRVQPRAGVATLQCTVADGTGEILVVFLGRRQLSGWQPGAYVTVTGTVGERNGRLEILNPEYRLLAATGSHP